MLLIYYNNHRAYIIFKNFNYNKMLNSAIKTLVSRLKILKSKEEPTIKEKQEIDKIQGLLDEAFNQDQ